MNNLKIEKLVLGAVQTNCYLAVNADSRDALIIDPADKAKNISQKIQELKIRPVGILLTHGHFDHIGAALELKKEFQIPIFAQEQEKVILEDPNLNLSSMFGLPFQIEADIYLKDQEELELAGFHIKVLHTPGHTKGGICYYLPQELVMFSGDTLFRESVGRTDFPTGSASVLRDSVKRLLTSLPENTIVYPGHDMKTDIAHERRNNPFA